MTFQRFNGDELNEGAGWTEGFPIDYQDFKGNLTNKDHPATTIAYWRIYWKFLEPEMGKYRWDMVDKALQIARSRGQTLLLRIAPYGTGDERDRHRRHGPTLKGRRTVPWQVVGPLSDHCLRSGGEALSEVVSGCPATMLLAV